MTVKSSFQVYNTEQKNINKYLMIQIHNIWDKVIFICRTQNKCLNTDTLIINSSSKQIKLIKMFEKVQKTE